MCNLFFKTFLTFGKSKIRGRAPQALLPSALFLYRSGSMSRHGLWEAGFGLADGLAGARNPAARKGIRCFTFSEAFAGSQRPCEKALIRCGPVAE